MHAACSMKHERCNIRGRGKGRGKDGNKRSEWWVQKKGVKRKSRVLIGESI